MMQICQDIGLLSIIWGLTQSFPLVFLVLSFANAMSTQVIVGNQFLSSALCVAFNALSLVEQDFIYMHSEVCLPGRLWC